MSQPTKKQVLDQGRSSVINPEGPELPPIPGAPGQFEDMVERGAAEDPLVRFLQKRWQLLLMLGLVVGAVLYGRYTMQSGYKADMERAADAFSALRLNISSLDTLGLRIRELSEKKDKTEQEAKQLASLEEEKKNIEKKLSGSIAALKIEREPYAALAKVYEEELLPGEGSEASVLASLEQAKTQFVKALESKDTATNFFAELAYLRAARIALGEVGKEKESLEALLTLVRDGNYVHVSAAESFVRGLHIAQAEALEVTVTPDQVREAITAATQKHPTVAEQYEKILSSL